ncbi:MAG: DUF2142 domain-containing protein [Candidatus Firestonebacteria bacterium]
MNQSSKYLKIFKEKYLFITVILIVSLIKGLIWISIIPIFQTPDEPGHFCYVQKIAEKNKLFLNKTDNYLTQEIILGFMYSDALKMSKSRINEYKFIDGEVGKYEDKFNEINTEARNKTSIFKEQYVPVIYPPLYYIYSSIPYYMFYSNSLIVRIFAVRIFSLLLGLLTIFVIYKIAELVFVGNKYIAGLLAILISFQPMFTFISSAVNSDSLHILFFTIFLYYYIKINILKYTARDIIFLILVIGLGVFTKQHFILSLMILLISAVFFIKVKAKKKIIVIASVLLLFILTFIFITRNYPYHIFEKPIKDFWKYLFTQLFPFLYSRFPSTFFGNFGWTNVPVPDFYLKILICLFLFFLFLYIIDIGKSIFNKKSFLTLRTHIVLLVPIIIYSASLIYLDFNINVGLQGRYFFPVISLIYICLVSGFLSIVPKKVRLNIIFITAIIAVSFNIICLITVIIPRYYQ